MKAWLDQLRCGMALWLWPSINTAHGKRHLEAVAKKCGASNSVAKRIAAKFFETLHDGK